MKIAVDAMGGDLAPQAVVEGSIKAARDFGSKVILVGRPEKIEPCLASHRGWEKLIEIYPAADVIGMEDSPSQAIRKKKDSSIRRSAELVKSGQAAAMVSAGNTGAVMATAKMVLRTLRGIDRPAIAAVLPSTKGYVILIDVGANVDCQSKQLFQFAVMGEVYARVILGLSSPRIGLMSIGEEHMKGNEVTRKVHQMLKNSPLNFIGNIEGKKFFSGDADVVVVDGFTGNVALKVAESLGEMIALILKREISRSLMGKLGILFLIKPFKNFKRRVDYAEYGGAPLLGINGICIISHGSSSPLAIKNSIKLAEDYAARKVNLQIEEEIRVFSSSSKTVKEPAQPSDIGQGSFESP